MKHTPFYDPRKTYEENFLQGPFGVFKDGRVFKNSINPKHAIFGLPLHLPFGIAAGPLINGKFTKAALDKGFDVVVYKTVRTREHPCNPWPNVVPLHVKEKLTLGMQDKGIIMKKRFRHPLTITNSFGVPSKHPEFWMKDLADTVKHAKKGQAVIASFQGTTTKNGGAKQYINDFVLAAKMVKQTGTKIFEVNLSCPNEGTAHLLCFDLQRSKEVIYALKNEIGNLPLITKLAYFRSQEQLKKLLTEIGSMIQGIATINTMPAKIFSKEGKQALPGENRLVSGTCGYGVKWAGLDMVKRLKILREELGLNFSIFGTGGVMIPEDYFAYREAGADVVMSATGALWNPYLAQEIKAQVNIK